MILQVFSGDLLGLSSAGWRSDPRLKGKFAFKCEDEMKVKSTRLSAILKETMLCGMLEWASLKYFGSIAALFCVESL